jgi:hypothetical protein
MGAVERAVELESTWGRAASVAVCVHMRWQRFVACQREALDIPEHHNGKTSDCLSGHALMLNSKAQSHSISAAAIAYCPWYQTMHYLDLDRPD